MKHLSYLLLCAFALTIVSCTETPEEKGIALAKEVLEREAELRNSRLEVFDAFLDEFDPARFLDRTSARESLDGQLDEKLQAYNINKHLMELKYENMVSKYKNDAEDLAAFEEAFNRVIRNAPPRISELEMPLFSLCDEIIMSIALPTPSIEQVKSDIMGQEFTVTYENYYFPERKWIISNNDNVELNLNGCDETADSCKFKVMAYITKPGKGTWEAELVVNYAMGAGDEWIYHNFTCENMLPRLTNQYDEQVKADIVNSENGSILVLTNTTENTLVVGGQTFNDSNDGCRFGVTLEPKASVRVEGEGNVPAIDYRIEFAELD